MKVLLTGANGFVGSHVLDRLMAEDREVVIAIRRSSDTRFIQQHLPRVEVRYAPLTEPGPPQEAFAGVEVVIHCAGKTKAVRRRDYFAVNAEGTRRVVAACNAHADRLHQFVLISSLAASGPGTRGEPAREEDPPRPVTVYGESKLRGEEHVRQECEVPFTILRPCAVYGPRDTDMYLVFKAVAAGVLPLLDGGRQFISFIYGPDLARAVGLALGREQCLGRTYNLASAVPWTLRAFGSRVAKAVGVEPVRLPVPRPLLYAACLWQEVRARITGRPSIINLQKIPEYTAPGWVADTSRAARELGFRAPTDLDKGLRETVRWYRDHEWLQEGKPAP